MLYHFKSLRTGLKSSQAISSHQVHRNSWIFFAVPGLAVLTLVTRCDRDQHLKTSDQPAAWCTIPWRAVRAHPHWMSTLHRLFLSQNFVTCNQIVALSAQNLALNVSWYQLAQRNSKGMSRLHVVAWSCIPKSRTSGVNWWFKISAASRNV